MPGVRNIRWILRDTLAILVWHAVFSSLGNTFKAPQRYASLDTRLLVTGRATLSHRFHSSDMCVACLFGKHVTPVTGMPVANGPSPKHLLYSVVLLCASLVFPSAALAAVNAVSVKQQMCEKTRVCLFTHVLYVDVLACAKATALLSGWQSCNGARDTVFIYPCPSCHCCVWREFAELGTLGELSNPLTLPTMQNVTAQHTPWILSLEKQKLMGTFSKCTTFTGLFKCREITDLSITVSLCCLYSKESWKFFFP